MHHITSSHASAINEMVEAVHGHCIYAGWWSGAFDSRGKMKEELDVDHLVATKLALVHSEISEALEGYRKRQNDDHLHSRESVEVELADAVIRILDIAGFLALDLGGAIREKFEYNKVRSDHKAGVRAATGGKRF